MDFMVKLGKLLLIILVLEKSMKRFDGAVGYFIENDLFIFILLILFVLLLIVVAFLLLPPFGFGLLIHLMKELKY